MLKKVSALALLEELKGKGLLDKNSSREILRDIKECLDDEADRHVMRKV
ncbi:MULTISPECIES: hypothetical protein [Antarcticibacterium]|nr:MULTISPECIES: hypothetical protein [Antarcticibacterium]